MERPYPRRRRRCHSLVLVKNNLDTNFTQSPKNRLQIFVHGSTGGRLRNQPKTSQQYFSTEELGDSCTTELQLIQLKLQLVLIDLKILKTI